MLFPCFSHYTRLAPEGSRDNSGKKSGRLLQPLRRLSGLLPRAAWRPLFPLVPSALVQMFQQQPWELFQVLPLWVSFPIASLSSVSPQLVPVALNTKTCSSSDIRNPSVSSSDLWKCLSQTEKRERAGVPGDLVMCTWEEHTTNCP